MFRAAERLSPRPSLSLLAPPPLSRSLKQGDLLKFLKIYEAEFNQPDLHDRILVFDVVASEHEGVSDLNENEISKAACNQDKNKNDPTERNKKDTMEILNEDADMKTGSRDGEIDGKNAIGDHPIDKTVRKDCEDNDGIGSATITLLNNDGVEIQEAKQTDDTSNGNEMKDQQQLENLKDKEQNENGREILSEGNDATRNESNDKKTSFPTSEEQVIRQHKFYIHSSWLAVQSSYFRSLFYSGMKESNAKEVHVQILDSEEKAHLMLLEAMYKIDVLDKANVDELLNVLKLADKYDVQFVFKKCKYCLQEMVNSLEVCEKIMRFIKIENTITEVEDLASTLQFFLVQAFSPLDEEWQTTSFKELCKPSVRYLLSSNELLAASENTIFHALMYWIEQQGIENVLESERAPSILSVVRFELISIDYLYNIVQHDSIAKKFPDFNHHYLNGISYHALSDDIKDNLPKPPVKRKVSTQPFIPYTWEIPTDKLQTLAATEKELKSDEFWFSGYKMVLTIKNVKKDNLRRSEKFSATLSLQVTNLTQISVVEVSFYPARKFFSEKMSHKTYKLKKNSQIEFSIHYEIENERFPMHSFTFGAAVTFGGVSTLADPLASFNFGSLKTQFLSLDINMNLA